MKTPRIYKNPYDALALVLLRDTTTGRMLRSLYKHGHIQQALFMTEYHRRCARTKPSRSSFSNNFGWRLEQHARTRDGQRVMGWIPERPLRVIVVEREGPSRDSMRNVLYWSGPDALLASLSDGRLQQCYEIAERQWIEPRATDAEGEMRSWVIALGDEVSRRSNISGRKAA